MVNPEPPFLYELVSCSTFACWLVISIHSTQVTSCGPWVVHFSLRSVRRRGERKERRVLSGVAALLILHMVLGRR